MSSPAVMAVHQFPRPGIEPFTLYPVHGDFLPASGALPDVDPEYLPLRSARRAFRAQAGESGIGRAEQQFARVRGQHTAVPECFPPVLIDGRFPGRFGPVCKNKSRPCEFAPKIQSSGSQKRPGSELEFQTESQNAQRITQPRRVSEGTVGATGHAPVQNLEKKVFAAACRRWQFRITARRRGCEIEDAVAKFDTRSRHDPWQYRRLHRYPPSHSDDLSRHVCKPVHARSRRMLHHWPARRRNGAIDPVEQGAGAEELKRRRKQYGTREAVRKAATIHIATRA